MGDGDCGRSVAHHHLLAITTSGQIIRQRVGETRRIGRSTQGVRLIRMEEGGQVATVARVVTREDEE